jgi:hypothetical protein
MNKKQRVRSKVLRIKNHKKSQEELENQLHHQYAENDNSRTQVFTSFIIGIVALFGFYGYVFVNTYSESIGILIRKNFC